MVLDQIEEKFRSKDPGLLKYQYEQLIKQLMLLQDHAAARTCPYTPSGEMCIRKHLLTIEAYAQETIPMEDDSNYKEKLGSLISESLEYRANHEAVLCGADVDFKEGLEAWARKWRKEFEIHSLTCKIAAESESSFGPREKTPARAGKKTAQPENELVKSSP